MQKKMKHRITWLFGIIIYLMIINAQTAIAPGVYGDDLRTIIVDEYKTNFTLGYTNARDTMFAVIDNNDGVVMGIYTEYSVPLIPGSDPSTTMYNGGINTEHLWPQSMYSGSEPMKSDLHHLFPCKENVNSSRGNNPFGENLDEETDNWYYLDENLTNIPNENIDEYSESYISGGDGEDRFEPREDRKGDTARAMFYFKTMYSSIVDESFFEVQKDVLFDWHYDDPVDEREFSRTWNIAYYQDDLPNPFIIDPTLVWRAYFSDLFYPGDVNSDQSIDVLDIVLITGNILETTYFTELQYQQGDLNTDFSLDVLDIVLLVSIILQ